MAAKRGKRAKARDKASTRKHRGAIEGRLVVARPGSAYVETAEGTFAVARGGLNGGMNGDLASVTLARRGPGEPLATVRSVVSRACVRFVGTFGQAGPLGAVVPLDERIRHDFFVLPDDESPQRAGVREGDVVVARILTYPSRHEAGVVTVERSLGTPDGLDMCVERIVASHDLATSFSAGALEQAEGICADVAGALASEPKRRDLRDLTCVTIDPKTARDFDDAVSCARTREGGYLLGVHIADVTHYVRWDTPIDLEARARGCSAYLVDRVLPMLPERLCNDVCSLVPNEDRLAMSVLVRLDAAGEVVSAEACASAIRSRARLAYDDVDALLSFAHAEKGTPVAEDAPDAAPAPAGPDAPANGSDALARDATAVAGPDANAPALTPQLAAMLRDLDELAALRRRVRRARGSVDFEGVEAKVELDGSGVPTGVAVRRRTRATSLVEEAMLVANEAVAGMLAGHEDELPAAFRVHEQPSPDSLSRTVAPLRELEAIRPAEEGALRAGDPFAIQRVLERARGTSAEIPANALLLRAMKRAVYLPRNDGHYALGARAYCHFTSPIRRYPDMCVHRALKALLGMEEDCGWGRREMREAAALMPQLCRTSSERERAADAAGRESQAAKMAELYQRHVGERFSGVVVGVERYGLFVRLDDTCAEGLVPTRALGDGWFAYDEARMTLTGESTGRVWRLGRRVVVEVAGCNPARGHIDFRIPRLS